MPSVEEMLRKSKSKKSRGAVKSQPKKTIEGKESSLKNGGDENNLVNFDPFGVKFMGAYPGDSSDEAAVEKEPKQPAVSKEKNDLTSKQKIKTKSDNSVDDAKDSKKPAALDTENEKNIEVPRVGAATDSNEAADRLKSVRLSSKQEVIYDLLKKHRDPETLITPVVKSSHLSKILVMTESSLRKQIQRMEEKGVLERHQHISGPEGGTSYVVFDVKKERNSFLDELVE